MNNQQKQLPAVFSKKGDLKNFAKSTGKNLCRSLFLNCHFIKKETPTQMFSYEFCDIFKNACFSKNTSSGCSGNRTFITYCFKYYYK